MMSSGKRKRLMTPRRVEFASWTCSGTMAGLWPSGLSRQNPRERGHLGSPQAGLHRHQHEGVIAPPGPCVPIRSKQQGVDFRAGQEWDQGARVALAGNGQNALELRRV